MAGGESVPDFAQTVTMILDRPPRPPRRLDFATPMKNLRPDLNGILVVNKPLSWTSADVCRYIRKGTRGAKVGHAGTLDPLATGVLVICLGRATKLIDSIMVGGKIYLAGIDLAHTSPTDDLEGARTVFEDAQPPSLQAIESCLDQFRGSIMQAPPIHSAIWIDGERAYKIARRGEELIMAKRPVQIDGLRIVSYEWPILTLEIHCGKGTYIRSLARDLGLALGVGGMLISLERTAVGPYTIDQAIPVESITEGIEPSMFHTDLSQTAGPAAISIPATPDELPA